MVEEKLGVEEGEEGGVLLLPTEEAIGRKAMEIGDWKRKEKESFFSRWGRCIGTRQQLWIIKVLSGR